MTRGALSTRDRGVLAGCAIGAVAVALVSPLVFRWLLDRPLDGSIEIAVWVGAVLAPVPACLALAAVVLTARAPAGTVIAVVSGLVSLLGNLQWLQAFDFGLGARDIALWVLWVTLLGCALLGADAMAWRLGTFTAASGLAAGALVAVLQIVVKLSMYNYGAEGFSLRDLPAGFWLQEYAVPAAMLVLAGVLAGMAVQRLGVRQETAGLV